MAKPTFDPNTGKPVFDPATGKPAVNCLGIACADCEGHGPITATITTTGGCDTGGGCVDGCDNQVISLEWDAENSKWEGFGSPWTVMTVWCVDDDPDVWHIELTGGCGTMQPLSIWQATFDPEDCETDNGNGYPTHSGIDMGVPDYDDCWDDCQPTVALS